MNAIYITQGQQAVGHDADMVVSTILGSCISVCLWDPVAGVGGMNHMLLPGAKQDNAETQSSRKDICETRAFPAMPKTPVAIWRAGCGSGLRPERRRSSWWKRTYRFRKPNRSNGTTSSFSRRPIRGRRLSQSILFLGQICWGV